MHCPARPLPWPGERHLVLVSHVAPGQGDVVSPWHSAGELPKELPNALSCPPGAWPAPRGAKQMHTCAFHGGTGVDGWRGTSSKGLALARAARRGRHWNWRLCVYGGGGAARGIQHVGWRQSVAWS